MKKILYLTLFIFVVTAFFSQSAKAQTEAQRVELCTRLAGGATLQNSYTPQLLGASPGQRPPNFRQAVAFRARNVYRITVCTDEDSQGEAIVQVLDGATVLGTNLRSDGTIVQNFDIESSKTGPYMVMVSIKDGREGSAVIVISHVRSM